MVQKNKVQLKITVVIPTRDRSETLKYTLKTVIQQKYENLEIIISDNFSNDNTKDMVMSFNDKRIKYYNTGNRLSMSENWEFALDHVDEGWVTIIGDDDGLLPDAIERIAKIITENTVSAISTKICSYVWPFVFDNNFGLLSYPLQKKYEIRNSKKWLKKLMVGKATYDELPMLYQGGFVDIQVLKKIKNMTGKFYLSCIPDIYSSVAISCVVDKYLYISEPFAISGVSKNSTGTSTFSEKDGESKKAYEKFKMEGNIPLHTNIPLCDDGSYPLSIEALIYESYLQCQPLHQNSLNFVSHEQQLQLILSSMRRKKVLEWSKKFANIHNLDFDKIYNNSRQDRMFFNLIFFIYSVFVILNTYTIGSQKIEIENVYEASKKAYWISQNNPTKLNVIFILFKKAILKLKSKIV